jgi:hypothetical protein
MAENSSLAEAVDKFPVQGKRLLKGGKRLPGVVKVMIRVTDAVKRLGLTAAVAECPVEGESLLAVGQCLVELPEPGVIPADVVEGFCLPGAVTGVAGQGQGLASVRQRFRGAALALHHPPEIEMDMGPGDLVTKVLQQAQGVPEVGMGVIGLAEPGERHAEAPLSVCLPLPAAAAAGSGEGCTLDSGPVVPVPAPVEDDVVSSVRAAAAQRQYRDNAVLVTMKVLEAAGIVSLRLPADVG